MSDIAESTSASPIERPVLGVWDAISIIVGIVVGASIFKVPAIVFSSTDSGLVALAVWGIAGLLCLVGALCYAELATRFRQGGGEYLFLTKAFGPGTGFLFGWAQLTGVFSGSIGALAYVFADYAGQLGQTDRSANVWWAIGAVWVLTAIHAGGIRTGKCVQNALTVIKITGLLVVLIAGLCGPGRDALSHVSPPENPNMSLALILVLYAYGGWNDAAFVASEVRDRRRNIPRALCGGLLAITLLYGLVNWAYFRALGLDMARGSFTPATDVMLHAEFLSEPLKSFISPAVGMLVMLSALGAVHGLLFTGSRLYFAMGVDHPFFARLGRWDERCGAPIWALLAQAVMTTTLMFAVGTESGRNVVDAILVTCGHHKLPWEQFRGGFETLTSATAPVFWGFFLLNGLALFVFRHQDRARRNQDAETDCYRVPFYPLTPLVFCGTSAFMLYQSVLYVRALSLLALIPLLIGIPLYLFSRRGTRS